VLIKGEKPEADVVDGQQRLTTLTILLAALRTLVDGVLEPKYARALTNFLYQEGDPIIRTVNRYRLKLRERDEEFFRQNVQDEKGLDKLLQLNNAQLTDSQKNIQAEAYPTVKTKKSDN
jgi:uncharacterized protein with ParB-like and HNH nuclease domain